MKRKPEQEAVASPEDILKITPLGAGNEVGRSCILLEYKGKTVMMDCGLHPAHSGLAALPFFDMIDPADVDVILITQYHSQTYRSFHLDHAAALPYFVEKTNFKGKIYMTHPTKAIFKWLLTDYVKVSNAAVDDLLYSEQDLINCYSKVQAVDYHQEIVLDGIKFVPFNAGHVLGAAMFLVEIAGVKVFYTGDYSREEDRHLMAAENPKCIPNVLITESTYGVASHQPRHERESLFTGMVHRVVGRGGRCLIPVFALGRAQELLLVLDEYWQAHPELHNVPIYYASALAKKCMTVYQTYTNMMNERIRKLVKTSNPFQFKHISNLKSVAQFDDVGPCVMMASPGMLQSGLSRELFELWCSDKKNGVVIPGYVVEGTLAKEILSQPNEITTMAGVKVPLRLSIEYISFSAHVDYPQNSEFIDALKSKHVVLVHGEGNEMGRLRNALRDKYADAEEPINIYMPRNCESVELVFKGEKIARIIGQLAEKEAQEGDEVTGIMISKDFKYTIIAPEEMGEFAVDLTAASLEQRYVIKSTAAFSLIRWFIENMFGKVKLTAPDCMLVCGAVSVCKDEDEVVVEWLGSSSNDMIADSVISLVLQADNSPASVKATKSAHTHSHHDKDGHVHEEEEQNIDNPEVVDGSKKRFLVTQVLKSFFGEDAVQEVSPNSGSPVNEKAIEEYSLQDIGQDAQSIANSNPELAVWTVSSNCIVILSDNGATVLCGEEEEKTRVETILHRITTTFGDLGEVLVL